MSCIRTGDAAIQLLCTYRAELQDMGVSSLGVFGSVARGTAGSTSDIDILVEFGKPVGLFAFARLQERLEKLLGQRVDLVTREALRPTMRAEILAEVRRAF